MAAILKAMKTLEIALEDPGLITTMNEFLHIVESRVEKDLTSFDLLILLFLYLWQMSGKMGALMMICLLRSICSGKMLESSSASTEPMNISSTTLLGTFSMLLVEYQAQILCPQQMTF